MVVVIPMLDNLLGRRFGRLIVKDRAEDTVSKSGRHRVMWVCSCDCGNEVVVLSDNLKRGKTQSCGCLRNDKNKERFSTHRATDTRLYGIWSAMKTRCLNKNSHAYKDYGERGIHVCDKWINDFSAARNFSFSKSTCDFIMWLDADDVISECFVLFKKVHVIVPLSGYESYLSGPIWCQSPAPHPG